MKKKVKHQDRLKICQSVRTIKSFGRHAKYVCVLCPSKQSYDGLSVQTSLLVGLREVEMALTAKQKKLPKALQRAILAKQKGMGKKKKKNGKKKRGGKKRSRG